MPDSRDRLALLPRLTFALLLCGLPGLSGVGAQVVESRIGDQLRLILESAPLPLELELGGERISAGYALPAFYEQRVYQPAWVTSLGPSPAVIDLVESLSAVEDEGLNPADYHLARLRSLLEELSVDDRSESAMSAAELDLLSTDAFLTLGAHLVSGRVDPASFDREWQAILREVDLVARLNGALERGDVSAALAALLPGQAGYFRLRDMGRRYRAIVEAGGWQPVSEGPALKPGDSGPRVGELVRRLRVTDGLEPAAPETDEMLFDTSVEAVVRRFQGRHGLEADGIVGVSTLAALNVSASERLRQIYLNLERWHWLPQSLGERYVLVNLPAFALQAVEGGELRLEMKVAVGRRYRRTPVFSDVIRYLVFNPYWEVPPSLAIKDKLPEIRKDPTYFSKQGIRVLSGWGTDQQEIDPATVDWNVLGKGNFPYRLRQDPGPLNALGRVKFMFPNPFNIYLHDTPAKEAFARAARDISSGCIRLERPLDLAQLLLSGNAGWQPSRIEEYVADYQPRTISLETPWQVHLLYWTSWVDVDGVLQFRVDLYDRDRQLLEALGSSIPALP